MDNELIKGLDPEKQDLILNIYENNFDSSIDKTILCNNSINCIDISCSKSHYVDFDNRELINNIIQQKNELLSKDNLNEIEDIKHTKENLNEIEDIKENEIEWKVDNDESIEIQFIELSKGIKENLNEIKEIEEYLKILHTKLNEKKNKSKEIAKQLLKLI
tara:strand:- start:1942 stop:2424 length:483 start_codon:yes stop_codon:yes gene_type:complete